MTGVMVRFSASPLMSDTGTLEELAETGCAGRRSSGAALRPTRVGVEKVALLEALTATEVTAQRHIPWMTIPPWTAMRCATREGRTRVPAVLEVLEILPAGKRPRHRIAPGTAVKIMTGAPLPEGADTVVQVEHTDGSDTRVQIYRAPRPGSNLRRRGEDIRQGECAWAQTFLRPAELGRPGLGWESPGAGLPTPPRRHPGDRDEIIDPGEPDTQGKIINSNSYTLAGQIAEAGGTSALGLPRTIVRSCPNALPVGCVLMCSSPRVACRWAASIICANALMPSASRRASSRCVRQPGHLRHGRARPRLLPAWKPGGIHGDV